MGVVPRISTRGTVHKGQHGYQNTTTAVFLKGLPSPVSDSGLTGVQTQISTPVYT